MNMTVSVGVFGCLPVCLLLLVVVKIIMMLKQIMTITGTWYIAHTSHKHDVGNIRPGKDDQKM